MITPTPDPAEFDRAFQLLVNHFDPTEANTLFPRRAHAVYTAPVILWMLVYQRLHPDKSLEAAVQHLLTTQSHLLPDNKRIREKTLSLNTSSYSDARQWLPLPAAEWFAGHVSRSFMNDSPPNTRRVFLLDGTTLTLAPEPELRKKYPPAQNQYGHGAWPVALLTVAHELSSGAAIVPEIGAKYGPEAVSETTLAGAVMDRMPADSVVMADAGFGIFSVAWEAKKRELGFVFRLTNQRFQAYRRKARTVANSDAGWTGESVWKPSPRERKKHPEWPAHARLTVRIHSVRLPNGKALKVVTDDATASAEEVAQWYRQRALVEIDIRNVKVVLNTERMAARSVSMFRKELLLSMVAYNLVIQFRRQAAERAKCRPRELSFKRVWTTFQMFLWVKMFGDAEAWRAAYEQALGYAAKARLPKRPPGRQYEREAYPRRPKADQFKKRHPKPLAEDASE